MFNQKLKLDTYISIYTLKKFEKERKNKNNISTELFFILTKHSILSKNKNSQSEKEKIEQKRKQENIQLNG